MELTNFNVLRVGEMAFTIKNKGTNTYIKKKIIKSIPTFYIF